MKKKILVVYYTQSGQLEAIARKVMAPFSSEEFSIEWLQIFPEKAYTFPWSGDSFFDAMPESVMGIPSPLKPLNFQSNSYDLVLFAYQPWFLSPSIPATSVLMNPEFKKRLKGTPVITLIAARNMWISAQDKVKALLQQAEAKLVGNIVLEDKNLNLVSAVTIQYWMFTAKKDKFLGIFPKPGVSDEHIAEAGKFGEIISQALGEGKIEEVQTKLIVANAVEVHPNLVFIESRGSVIFKIWASTILKKQNRKLWLKLFKYYLVFGLFVLSPILITIYTLVFRPFLMGSVKKKIAFYQGVN